MTPQTAVSGPENGKGESPIIIPPVPPIKVMEQGEPKAGQAVLISPRAFGIHINGILVRFNEGRTPLTPELAAACEADPYVKDNGAEVIYRLKAINNRKGEMK